MRRTIISIGVAAVLLAVSGASAQIPVCPYPYTNATCSPDPPWGGSGPNVCAYDSGDSRYECTELSDYADEITVITDSGYVLAWGKKSWGLRRSKFCCRYYFGGTAPDLYVNAGDGHDTVNLHSPGENDYEGTTLVYDTGGNDVVRGSDYEDCDFPCDTISLGGWGDATHTVNAGHGDDWIHVTTGTNTLNGDDGNDMIVGLLGVDHVDGGNDDDIIWGLGSPDDLDGGYGADSIYGGHGDDSVYSHYNGTIGGEFVCGEAGADECLAPETGSMSYYCDCPADYNEYAEDTCCCGNHALFYDVPCRDPMGVWTGTSKIPPSRPTP